MVDRQKFNTFISQGKMDEMKKLTQEALNGGDSPEAIQKHTPQVVALSALLTTTMREMKTTLDAIAKAGLRNHVKTIVGGAPLTEKYAREIGADGYAPDAASAVDRVRELLGSK